MARGVTSPQSTGTWKRFGAFLRHPVLPDRVTGIRASALPALGKLFALDLLLMSALLSVAGVATLLGFEMPAHMIDEMGLTASLILFIVIGAPIGEELVFRSWLSGRPGHLVAALIMLALVAVVVLGSSGAAPLALAAAFFVGGALIVLALWLWRKRPPMGFFQRHFRWFYLGSTLAFASVHLANFTEGNALILLPLTLPQFLLGLILGYVRVTYGLWANIVLHAAHNSLFVAAILLGSAAA